MIKNYTDFEIILLKKKDQFYVQLGNSPIGPSVMPPVPVDLPDTILSADVATLIDIQESQLNALGCQLFECLVGRPFHEQWSPALRWVAVNPNNGLRLRFTLSSCECERLPLETLAIRNKDGCDFLVLDPLKPIVRSVMVGEGVLPRRVTLPLKVLVVTGCATGELSLSPSEQLVELQQALAPLVASNQLVIDYFNTSCQDSVDYEALYRTLFETDIPYDVVHFIGESALIDSEDSDIIHDDLYPRVVDVLVDSGVRVVNLQFWEGEGIEQFSKLQYLCSQLIARGLPAALMAYPTVPLAVATRFYQRFYSLWLSQSGMPFELTVTQARQLVRQECGERAINWLSPMLFIHTDSALGTFVEVDASMHSVHLKCGQILLEQGDVGAAVSELEGAYEKVPERSGLVLSRALVALAQSRQDDGDEQGALDACKRALSVYPDDLVAQLMRTSIISRWGDAALAQDRFDVALAFYNQIADAEKIAEVKLQQQRRRDILKRNAYLYRKTHQWGRAVESYQQLMTQATDAGDKKEYETVLKQVESHLSVASIAEQGSWSPGYILDDVYEIITLMVITDRCEIYRAKELRFARGDVVIKRLKPDRYDDEDACERFEREIVVLRLIEHKAVLRLLDDGVTEDGGRYFVTRFADRGSLRDYIQSQPNHRLSLPVAFEIAKSIAEGLEAAHSRGIVHRDIKPGNILLFFDSDGLIHPQLADFSIARIPETWREEPLTKFLGGVLCTPHYASPEQLHLKIADDRSDLYSWAIVFFEMLTGQFPATSIKQPSFPYYPSAEEFPLSFFTDQGILQEIAVILQKALNEDVRKRYQSAEALLDDLKAIQIPAVSDIERCLLVGKEYAVVEEWQFANSKFRRGLNLCKWYESSDDSPGRYASLSSKLQMGSLYAQGRQYLLDKRWKFAVDSFEVLAKKDNLAELGVTLKEITTYLQQAKSGLQLERRYTHILKLVEQEQWASVLSWSAEFDETYKLDNGPTVGEIRKQALYAQGKWLIEQNPVRAYYLLYELYQKDPLYKDVAVLCAEVAFKCAVGGAQTLRWSGKVTWLARAVKLVPEHRDGKTQAQLDEARHQLAKKLFDEDKPAAALQLEQISDQYRFREDARSLLVEAYYVILSSQEVGQGNGLQDLEAESQARYRLGMELWHQRDLAGASKQFSAIASTSAISDTAQSALAQIYLEKGVLARRARNWKEAVMWWDKAIETCPNFKNVLQWKILDVRARAAIVANFQYILMFLFLTVFLGVMGRMAYPSIQQLGRSIPLSSPVPAVVVTDTQPVMSSPSPESTQEIEVITILSTTETLEPEPDTRADSPTPSPRLTSTATPIPTPTATPTVIPTATPTRVPVIPTPPVAPTLLEPGVGGVVAGPVTFSWRGNLQGQQYFQVSVYHVTSGQAVTSPALRDSEWTTELTTAYIGECRWWVSIFENDRMLASANEQHFWFSLFSGNVCPPPAPDCGPRKQAVCEDGRWVCK